LSDISRNSGFTLLEVLIAVVLLGILTAALYGSYFGVIQARDRASSGMESRRELGATLDLIRREVSAAPLIATGITDKRVRFVVEDRDNFGVPSSTLELTTLAPPAGMSRSESGIVIVTYRIVAKDKKRILTRQERDLFSEDSTTPAFPQMEQISSFLVECSSDGSKWVKTWESTNQGLPRLVRVTVQVEEEGKPVEFSVLSAPRVKGP
jgi:general secretion pathway protein J